VAETAKYGKLVELAKLADRTVAVSTKLSLAGRKLAGSIVLWQRRENSQADNVAAEGDCQARG